jgi:hypothetical protein
MENLLDLNNIAKITPYLYSRRIKKDNCDTANNTFVPFFNLINGQKVVYDGRMLYEYTRYIADVPVGLRQHRNDYLNLMRDLVRENNIQTLKLGTVVYQVARGIIMEHEETGVRTLLALCIYKDAIFKFDRNNIDTSKMVLLIDNKFAREDKYKVVYKKINTLYLVAASVNKISFMYTDNVDSWCYNLNEESKIKFRNVNEMKEFLNKFNTLTYGEAPEL